MIWGSRPEDLAGMLLSGLALLQHGEVRRDWAGLSSYLADLKSELGTKV